MIWYKNKLENDIFVSTRVRLARNLADYPFPSKMTQKAILEARDRIIDVLKGGRFNITLMSDIDTLERQVMMEKHLISSELLGKNDAAVLTDTNDEVSIMLMEEDHIRIQVISSGLNISGALNKANDCDDLIESKLSYAFSQKYGYLTTCPTNTGTGIRLSVMMHLPALTMTGNVEKILNSATRLGLEVRGLYGEGSKAYGSLYQLSNRVTLGLSEEEIAERVENIATQIKKLEEEAREQIKDKIELKDRLWRSLGTLKFARSLSSKEAKSLLSDYILGTAMGIIDEKIKQNPLELMVLTEPANIVKISGKGELIAAERDIKRAELVRSAI